MKLASYIANGKPSFGVVVGDGIVTMNDKLGGRFATLRDAIAGGAIDEMKRVAQGAAPDQKLAGLKFLPLIPIRKRSSASASTTSPTPPSTAPRRRSCRTSSLNSSTRWWRMKARCCGRRCRPASTSRASSRW